MNLTKKLAKDILILTAVLTISGITSTIVGHSIKDKVEKGYQKTISTEQKIDDNYFNNQKRLGETLETVGGYTTGAAISIPIGMYLTADLSGKNGEEEK